MSGGYARNIYGDVRAVLSAAVDDGLLPRNPCSANGGQLSQDQLASIKLEPDELKSFAFVTVDQLTERTIPRLVRRIRAAVESKMGSAPVYLEHGEEPRNRAA
ncbi:hypothetical protein ACFV19_15620 [Streptomyces griseoluteus]|uniref:hypothetical protein n=1 Tax=Streptomyces griseoluteus TaxID=29306 RepID=UPI0036A78C8D